MMTSMKKPRLKKENNHKWSTRKEGKRTRNACEIVTRSNDPETFKNTNITHITNVQNELEFIRAIQACHQFLLIWRLVS